MPSKQKPLILTLQLDEAGQSFFDKQRKLYFPPELNFLSAHLTLFHQLPDDVSTLGVLEQQKFERFDLQITGLRSLGGGVAYQVTSEELHKIHQILSGRFSAVLIPQDRQGFRPHITIQNKVLPATAKALLTQLQSNFQHLSAQAIGLDLWTYVGGLWAHEQYFPFS